MSTKHSSRATHTRLIRAAKTAQATATTVGFRWPMFLYDTLDPTHPMSAETRRAYTEKAAAIMEGSVVAAQAWQRLWIDMVFGRVQPKNLPKEILDIADKSTTPASRRVRANAKRLTAKRLSGH